MEMERTTIAIQRYTQQRRRHFPQKNRRQVRHVSSHRARYVRGVLRRPQKMVRYQVLDETKNEELGLLESRRSRNSHRTQRGLAPHLPWREFRKGLFAWRNPA